MIISNSKLYQRYQINKNDSRRPPAFTLCLPFVDIIDWDKISNKFNFTSDIPKNIVEMNLSLKLSIRRKRLNYKKHSQLKQLNELTSDLNELLISSWIRQPNSFQILIPDNQSTIPKEVQVVKFIRDDCVCYKVFNINEINRNFSLKSYHITYGVKKGIHLELKFDKKGIMSRVVKAYIFLTRILIYPRGDRDYPIVLVGTGYSESPKYRDRAKGKGPHKPLSMSNIPSSHGRVFQDDATSWGITYSKITLDLLPKPYTTNCMDYSDIGYENEAHCTYSCCNDYFLDKYNKSIFAASVIDDKYMNVSLLGSFPKRVNKVHSHQNIWFNDTDHDHASISRYSILDESSKENELDKILEICQRKCPSIGCHRIYYIPAVARKDDDDNFVIFKLYQMSQPEIKSVSKVRNTTENFIVGVISAIGVWVGISCADILTPGMALIRRR